MNYPFFVTAVTTTESKVLLQNSVQPLIQWMPLGIGCPRGVRMKHLYLDLGQRSSVLIQMLPPYVGRTSHPLVYSTRWAIALELDTIISR